MLLSIRKPAKTLLLFGLLLFVITACGQKTSPDSATQTGNNGNKLVVYIVGFGEHLSPADAAKNIGYGYAGTFYSLGKVQPYLQATREFKNAQSIVFSYGGFTGEGKPNQFTCADTYDLRLSEDVTTLQTQIDAYLQKHPKTAVYLIGHSLGGVIAFAYMEQLIERTHATMLLNGGQFKGVAILDSPLNGVTTASGYKTVLIGNSFGCEPHSVDYTIVGELQTLGDTGQFQGQHASILGTILNGKFVSNQQAAEDAAKLGISVLIVGNTQDILWQPDVCLLGPNFLSTQYLSEIGKTGNGVLYVRSFKFGLPLCIPSNIAANHLGVVRASDVQKAIWEVFTGQNLDVLTQVTSNTPPVGLPTPTPTPTPQPLLTPGTWQGQATSNGGSPYPTQLVINSVNGNMFTGVYGIAGPGNSPEAFQGQISGNTITFTTPTQVMNIVTTYKGTISGNTITGTWSDPGGDNGTFTVTKQS